MKTRQRHVSAESLSAYLDGDLGFLKKRVVSAHLGRCQECRVSLEQMGKVKSELGRLGKEEPPESLWEKIKIQAAGRLPEHSTGAGHRVVRLSLALATTAAGLAWLAFVWLRQAPLPDASAGKALLAVQDAEIEYQKAIDALALALDQRGGGPEQVKEALATNLAAIDGAILEFRHLLKNRPEDLEVHQALLALYQHKVDLMTDVVLEFPK